MDKADIVKRSKINHVAEFRYASSDEKVATVSTSGKITATDNHNKCLFFDYLDVYEDDPEPNGTSVSTSQWRFERYMKKHGITAKLKRIRLEPENIEKCIEDGPIIVSVKPTTLYDKEGNIMLDKKDGHSMSVVGFCDNGFIKVSSWGKEYYIKPGSYTRFEYYQQVIFYDK